MIRARNLFLVGLMLMMSILIGCSANPTVAENILEAKEVDIKQLMTEENSAGDFLGADGLELNYADDSRIIFHSHAGLFICDKDGENWQLTHTLDFAPLEANVTQGDHASLIWADREEVLIMPRRYAPDNDNPITYRYLISEKRLEKTDGFQEQEDLALTWSYSEEGMKRMQQMYANMQQENVSLSNLYPVGGLDTGVYGFVSVGYDDLNALQSLQYGSYDENTDNLEMKEIIIP